MDVHPHHGAALRALEAQVSRRVSPLNQAWAWAVIIEALTAPPGRAAGTRSRPRIRTHGRTRRTLAWLHHEMQWSREDLEEAGAWQSDLLIEVDLRSDDIIEFCLPLLRHLAATPAGDPDGRVTIMDVQARAGACLRALTSEGHGHRSAPVAA
jgi:hypothetical protein